jgi:hypothetical protein
MIKKMLSAENLIRLIIIAIALFTAYKAYMLGWTDTMMPSVLNRSSTWSRRFMYVNRQYISLLHMNIVSISMATGVFITPLVLLCALMRPSMIQGKKATFLSCLIFLYGLSVYTFLRIDTPINYYASRYFLPLIIPSAIFLGTYILYMSKNKMLLTFIVIFGLSFNAYYLSYLYKYRPYQNRFEFYNDILQATKEANIIFLDNDRNIFLSFKKQLEYLGHKAAIVNPAVEIYSMRDYMVELSEPFSFLVTRSNENELFFNFEIVSYFDLESNSLNYTILYPSSARPVKERFYVYRITLDKLISLTTRDTFFLNRNLIYQYNNNNYHHKNTVWSKGDITISGIEKTFPKKVNKVFIRTKGWWLDQSDNKKLEIFINHEKVDYSINKNDIIILLEKKIIINDIRILSSTFVPQELGINNDNRKLGIDVIEITIG